MTANETQVGGDHYKRSYQHWDWVCDNNVPYLLAVATKYPTRWVDKNGVEDLKKSIHYLEKAIERNITMPKDSIWNRFKFHLTGLLLNSERIENSTRLFVLPLPMEEKEIITLISRNQLGMAISRLSDLIVSQKEGPGPHYIKG